MALKYKTICVDFDGVLAYTNDLEGNYSKKSNIWLIG